jgi:hypothetical protein
MNPLLNPHAIANNYHLVDPDGNVILPTLWDAVIQDDMIITMRPKNGRGNSARYVGIIWA